MKIFNREIILYLPALHFSRSLSLISNVRLIAQHVNTGLSKIIVFYGRRFAFKFINKKYCTYLICGATIILLLTGCSAADKIKKNDIYPGYAIEILQDLTVRLKNLELNSGPEAQQEIIDWANSVCLKTITDSSKYSFDRLLKEIEKTNPTGEILPVVVYKTNNLLLEAVIIELKFRTLTAVQLNLERIYKSLPAKQKFSRTIIFATANIGISETKTGLVNRQISIISALKNNNKARLRCWLALSRMLKETDIPASETGDEIVQRSPYGIMITKGEMFKKLKPLADYESDEEIKNYAERTLGFIKSSGTKYKEFKGEIVIGDIADISPSKTINEKAMELFNEAFADSDNFQKIKLYSKAIETVPGFAAALHNRGAAYFEIKDYKSAVKDFKTLLKIDSTKTTAYSYLGNCYLRMIYYDSSAAYYTEALRHGLKEVPVYVNRGLCYYKLHNYKLAVKDFTYAIALDSTAVSAYVNRAQCYLASGDEEKAEADYKNLIELDPLNSTHYYNLGCIYWNRLDWKNVIKVWEQGLKVNPGDENIKKNLPVVKTQLLKKEDEEKK